MADVKGIKKIGPGFSNETRWYSAVYDFAVDGGATGNYNIMDIEKDCILLDWYLVVETAFAGSSMTLDAGDTGQENALLADVAVGSLTQNAVFKMNASGDLPKRLTSSEYLTISILDAVATAGKLTVYANIAPSYAAD
jgi:hypothetical protein